MGIFDYSPPDATVLPENYEPGILDYIWYDPYDRRYCLSGPNACSSEEYHTTKMAQDYEKSCLSGGGGSPPAGMPDDIAYEIEDEARLRKDRG